MNDIGRLLICLIVVLAALVAGAASTLSAQSSHTALFVAIPHTFPEVDARAIVVREGHRAVVLLRADDANAETLAAALGILRRVARQALDPGQGQLLPIAGFTRRRPLQDQVKARHERVLEALSRRPVTQVGRFGPGRWIRYTPS